ncbi:MAG TPA: DUF2917 domain-containing protein [Burkholderiaceae bacterium]|jgi:hypothetical protein
MQNISAEESLSLAPCQLVSIRLEESRAVRMMNGRVWITIEADLTDYWLSVGETLVLPRGRHIVIEADSQHSCIDFFPLRVNPVALEGRRHENAKRTHCV